MPYLSMRTMVVYHMSHLQSAGVAVRQADPAEVLRKRCYLTLSMLRFGENGE